MDSNLVNHELSRKASAILSIIGDRELIEFLDEVYKLFEMYDTDEAEDREIEKEMGQPVNPLRLIQTARAMSRLAEKFERPFRKINKKARGFDAQCERELEVLNGG